VPSVLPALLLEYAKHFIPASICRHFARLSCVTLTGLKSLTATAHGLPLGKHADPAEVLEQKQERVSDGEAAQQLYYVHYLDCDRRLDEWVTSDKLSPWAAGPPRTGSSLSRADTAQASNKAAVAVGSAHR
jgi:hypothetical protein